MDIILHARASSSQATGVRRLAEIPLTHSEEGVHRVLAECGCRLDVPLDYIDLPTQNAVPYVKLSNWIDFLSRTSRLHYLVGTSDVQERQDMCREFWRRWSCVRATHPIFDLASKGLVQLENCVPLLHHGDEGRTYRKCPIMIISTHGFLGKGSHQSTVKKSKDVTESPMFLNFLGSTVTTHYVFCAMPHTLYKPCPQVLDTMLNLYASDAKDLATTGIKVMENGSPRRLYFWVLGIKGDLPYLGKSGHFTRSFSNCPKRAQSQKAGQGICWSCSAGIETLAEPIPWEDFRPTAKWLQTVGRTPGFSPFGPLLNIPHDHGHELYRADVWHVFHLGCGKNFAASSIVTLLETMEGSMDSRLQRLSLDFRQFCKQRGYYMYVAGISRELLGFEKSSDAANGHWSKGFITTRLLQWLENALPRMWPDSTEELHQVLASG